MSNGALILYATEDEKTAIHFKDGIIRCYNTLLLIWLGISSQIYAESQKENGEEKVEVQMELISAAQSIQQESSEVEQPLNINPKFQLKNELPSIANCSVDKISSWNTNFYLFGQLELILPGGGFAVRTQSDSISFEGAASIILSPWPAMKSTVSLIKSFDDSGKGWYIGLGAGPLIAFLDKGTGVTLDMPVFFGYQWAHSFWDVGVDFLPLETLFIPLPMFRVGLGF